MPRAPALNSAGDALRDRLTAALGKGAVIDPEPRYLEEPRGRFRGRAAAVLRPASVEEVSTIVTLCAEARVGIVPYSGGTGLVGGQVAPDGPVPVVLSFERMNRIRSIDTTDNILTAEAGAILADVHEAASGVRRLFPLSLASEGTARIGGLLSTNAGGINVLRYGNARDLCLGVEAVFADGSIHHGLGSLVKDNMGYDLRHLLIGAEGTLGLITAASLRLHPVPAQSATGWLAVESPGAALDLLDLLRDRLGNSIVAFELMSRRGFEFLAETMPDIALPPEFGTGWVVLAEVADGPGADLETRFTAVLETALERGIAADGLIAQSESQRRSFWTVRETIPEANRRVGSISSHDVSIPPSRIVEFIERGYRDLAALDADIRVNCFGHLGDGNLHYNVFPPRGRSRREFEGIREAVKTCIHDLADALGGSVGAEHGVGRLKVPDLLRYGDPAGLGAMRAIKSALDPAGIMDPGAVIAP